MSQQPFIQISNQQIYDKLVAIELRVGELAPVVQTVMVDHERLRSVELDLAGIRAVAKSAARHKLVAYPALVAALGAVGAAVIPLVVK